MSDSQDVIVVGVDGSPTSSRALEWALQEALRRRWSVQVVTTFGHPGNRSGLAESTVTMHARTAAEAAQAAQVTAVAGPFRNDVPVTCEVIEGSAAERLAEASRHAALLVVGSHGFGRAHVALVGSVAAGCIRHASCPVVVLPATHEHADGTDSLKDRVRMADAGPMY